VSRADSERRGELLAAGLVAGEASPPATASILIGTPPCCSTWKIAAARSLHVSTPSISFPSDFRAVYLNWGMERDLAIGRLD
jgi:hypothetical protein